MLRAIAAGFTVLVLLAALAPAALADEIDDETRQIGKQLQCPVCAGAPVSDSPSELAGQMRSVIRSKLEAGESEEQIIAYFVERYGESVLIEPPRRGFGLAVWLAPVVMLAAGGVLLWRLLRGWIRPRTDRALALGGDPVAASRNGAGRVNGTAGAHDGVHVDASPQVDAAPLDRRAAPPSSIEQARAELDRFRREA